jgi:phosphoglycerol transferase MdoB-like AlkP superfamily enzyme
MVLCLTTTLARAAKQLYALRSLIGLPWLLAFVLHYQEDWSNKKTNVYNILWVLVFGFATLNILGLVARRLEPRRSNMNLGEMVAILVVAVSIFLLGWEMLYVFHILPIRLSAH